MAENQKDRRTFKAIDFFCGGGGMTCGLRQARWEGLFAIEKNAFSFETLKYNPIDNKKHFQCPELYEIKKKYSIDEKMRNLEMPCYTPIGNDITSLFARLTGKDLFNYFVCYRKYDNAVHWNQNAKYLELLKEFWKNIL